MIELELGSLFCKLYVISAGGVPHNLERERLEWWSFGEL